MPFFIADGLNNIFAIAGFNTSPSVSNYRVLASSHVPKLPPGAPVLLALRLLFVVWWIVVLGCAIHGSWRLIKSGKPIEATIFACLIVGAAALSAVGLGVPRCRRAVSLSLSGGAKN